MLSGNCHRFVLLWLAQSYPVVARGSVRLRPRCGSLSLSLSLSFVSSRSLLKLDAGTIRHNQDLSNTYVVSLGCLRTKNPHFVIAKPHNLHSLHGDHGGQRLGFVDYNLVVPLSARFCLGSCKLLSS